MSRSSQALVLALIWLLTCSARSPAFQEGVQSNSERLDVHSKRLYNSLVDIQNMMKSYLKSQDMSEFDISSDLYERAGSALDYVDASSSMLYIYEMLSDASDRAHVRPFIQSRLSHYSELLGNAAEGVNVDVTGATRPGTAATAIHLKDEIRESKSLLESITLH
jgi:hypothetical protein